mgnify:FL=1
MTVGSKIKLLRTNKQITQEQLADVLNISGQAVSKWESDTSSPDISMLPSLADYFGITIDELLGHRLNSLTNKEKFIKFIFGNGILSIGEYTLRSGEKSSYYINTENFVTNEQISKIGEYFADCICENHVEANVVMGMAYHGIAFSTSTACALYQKYGLTMNYCHDRRVPDSRGRLLCGYTLRDGDRVIIVDDLFTSGVSLEERITQIKESAKVEIAAILVVVANRSEAIKMLEEKYNTKVISIITNEDIQNAITKKIVH